jgi:cytochrome c biogenesis protein CcdA
LVIFIAGFLAGLIALLTPCMFPMIPMTVTFFTKQSKTRSEGIFKALIYGASIVLIYVTFGLIFTAATGPLGLNDLSTNVWMNLVFFSIFVLFAFSFLGAFEIQLPSSWVNKMDKQADRGGLYAMLYGYAGLHADTDQKRRKQSASNAPGGAETILRRYADTSKHLARFQQCQRNTVYGR